MSSGESVFSFLEILVKFYRTFRDKTEDDDIMETLAEIAVELGKDLDNLKYAGKTITVKFKVSRRRGFLGTRRALTPEVSYTLSRVSRMTAAQSKS